MPVRVQREADAIATIVVSKHILIHEGDGSNNEPKQPDRDQDHLRGRTEQRKLKKQNIFFRRILFRILSQFLLLNRIQTLHKLVQ